MVPPHPNIVWQMNKTLATVAFVMEAAVAVFTRTDISDEERARLRQAIERLVEGAESLSAPETVDEWLERTHVPRQYPFGALPPPEFAWQMGKTVAVLDFVREAEHALVAPNDLEPDEKYTLEAKIDRLKDGSESLGEDDTFSDWLERLRDHHP